jgi:glycosyltransferase involved in cell wall biosynthesis
MDVNIRDGGGGESGSGNGTIGNTRPLISIAMCTYNGEAYLGGQLISFLKQAQRPDELVACDDGSTDNTLQVLDQFSKEASFPVKVYRNQQRLGPTKNFEKALSLCSGDFIFLSDQDDVWMPQKVNIQLQALKNNPGAGYAFSDALIVDEMLRPMGYTMWQSIKFTPGQRRQFRQGKQVDMLLKHNVVTGAAMAFRAELKSIILPIPDEIVHDEWIALLASSAGMHGLMIEEPLIEYRQHSQQLLGGRKVSFVEQSKEASLSRGQSFESRLRQEEVKYSQVLDRLVLTGQSNKHVSPLFDAKIQHLRVRQSIHKHPHYARLFNVARECLALRYHRFSFGWKSAARDLLL